MNEQWVVFDIDGVLADPTHRVPHILKQPKDWDAFFDAARRDSPRLKEIELLKALAGVGYRIVLLTGRSDRISDDTEVWLRNHNIPFDALYMREDGDHRHDTEVKPEQLAIFMDECGVEERNILCIFEDRRAVVDHWRDAGFLCFQNAPGEF